MYAMQRGFRAGYAAMRQALYEDPLQRERDLTWDTLSAAYTLMWAYYDNQMFERDAVSFNTLWSTYKQLYGLYRDIRLVYNPVTRTVDFYAANVYPGLLSTDDKKLRPGTTSAIPFPEETPDVLRSGIRQFWQWSNWQARKSVMVRYGAALGSVLVEVVDDLSRGVVVADIWKPGLVRDLELDSSGNVKFYALEYLVYDEEKRRQYTYRKEVDGAAFSYFKDDEPAGSFENPYGFTPAVWMKHVDTGSERGRPAFTQYGKVDELNGVVSHTHDQIHKVIGAPMVLWTSNPVGNLFETRKRPASDTTSETFSVEEQEKRMILKGGADGRVDSLAGNLPFGEVMLYIDKLLGEIEDDHPELRFYRELRAMNQVTGPAAERLMGDVDSRLTEAKANYDRGSVALFQMALAIGGFRATSGAWGPFLTRQQEQFLPFGLDSYKRGDLDFTIGPRPLLTPTRYETALENQAFWTGVGQAVSAGVPLETVLRDAGWTEEQISTLGQDKVNEIKRQQALAQEDVIPPVDQQGRPNTNGTTTTRQPQPTTTANR